MKRSKLTSLAILILSTTGLTSCAATRSNYVEVNKILTLPTESENVEYFVFKPSRAAMALGFVNVKGNEFTRHEDIIKDGKKKAAALGGHFILQEQAGVETKTIISPGYSSFVADQTVSAYSVGPTVSTHQLPWAVFSVWVYKPAHTGIDIDDNAVITGFHLNSNAESVGLRIGDQVLGIDGFDIKDAHLPQHIMGIQPGDSVNYTVRRNGSRMDFTIIALTNS